MSNKSKYQTIFNKSMKECLISRLAKHILLISHAKEQIGANIGQKYCLKDLLSSKISQMFMHHYKK